MGRRRQNHRIEKVRPDMPLLGYQDWKADKVERGECRQTIRAERKYPVKVGDTLYHYRRLRSPQARKVLETVCTETFQIMLGTSLTGKVHWVSERPFDDFNEIARLDGFKDKFEMADWFIKNHKIKPGTIVPLTVIRW